MAQSCRRMAISLGYQLHGVESLLLDHIIAHARDYKSQGILGNITLSSSMYQKAATSLYRGHGFVEANAIQRELKYLFTVDTASVHFFELEI